MMILVYKAGVITLYQYKGNQVHIIIELRMNKYIFFRLIRIIIWATGIMQSDAHMCHIRIQHMMISLAYQQQGVPMKAIINMLIALQWIGLYSKIGFGEESIPFRVTFSQSFQIIFQGERAAPGYCIVVLALFIQSTYQRGHTTTKT